MRTMIPLVLALAALGCQKPAPFDPGADCAKLDVCGQCASRGGCVWCGDTGKGQCMAVGHAECSAPASLSKTPDACPAPPADTRFTAATASASGTSSPMKEAVGPKKYEEVRHALMKAFPHASVTDASVDGVLAVLLHKGPRGAATRENAPITRMVKEGAHRLYQGHATHHRHKSVPPHGKPMESKFTLPLPMVRVSLPDKIDAAKPIIETVIGEVDLSRDHLLGSIELVAAKYGDPKYLGYQPERVDLITPTRIANTRFGAMAVYVGYRKKADRAPSFYMLEAGSATGDAKMIYFSPSMAPIPSVTSYYLPTPFVTMNNTYSGGLTMKAAPDEDEPEQLLVKSFAPGDKDPYITVTLQYKRSPTIDMPVPAEITADAAARVALIAETMGVASAIELQKVLSEIAKTLYWQVYPQYGSPTPPVAHP